MRRWLKESYGTLQMCFEVTGLWAFCEPHRENTVGHIECNTDYINFCVDCTAIREGVTKGIKVILNVKNRVFSVSYREELRAIQ